MISGRIVFNPIFLTAVRHNPSSVRIFEALERCRLPFAEEIGFDVILDNEGACKRIEVNITSFEHESGTPGSFLLKGYLKPPIKNFVRYVALYDPKTGVGSIVLLRENEKHSQQVLRRLAATKPR